MENPVLPSSCVTPAGTSIEVQNEWEENTHTLSGELENAGKRGPGGKEKEWTDCVADDLRLFGVTGDWKTAALDPGAWYNTVQEGGCRFMAAWVREEENASNQRQKKRDAEEADKVEVAPGVTVASLRRFRTALIGPTQGLPKRRRLCRY